MLLPGTIESTSSPEVAITNDEFALIVEKEFVEAPLEIYFITPVVLA